MKTKPLLISATALLLLLVSCGDAQETPAPTQSQTESTPVTVVTEAQTEEPVTGLAAEFTPEMQKTLGLEDYTCRIYLRDNSDIWSNPDMIGKEGGDRLDDAVYRRNLYLEETYGFKIDVGYSDEAMTDLAEIVLSGDDAYDFAFPKARQASVFAQRNVLCDLYTVDYLDFNSGVWSRMFNDTLAFDGKLFYAAGDISINSYESVRALMFNKEIARNFDLADPYQLVRDGNWTIEEFDRMCVTAAKDLNGDQTMTTDDQWGMAWQSALGGITFYYGCDEHLVTMNDEQLPEIALGSERSIAVYDKISDMIADHNVYLQTDNDTAKSIFNKGHSLFMTEVIYMVNMLRSADFEFGLLPLPKYDTKQENYIQFADGWCISPVVVPASVQNTARSGFLIQALAEASAKFVKPEYYEIILKSKLTRDEESAEMLDIIFKNFVLDNCDIFSWSGIQDILIDGMNTGRDLKAIVEKYSNSINKAITKSVNAFESMKTEN